MAGLAIGLMAVTVPVFAAGYWLATGVRGPLSAAGSPVLPAFIAASSGAPYQSRTLVLRQVGGVLTYQLLRDSDPVLGEPELPEASSAATALDTTVASLGAPASGDTVDAAQALSAFDIGSVLLPAPVNQTLATQLNGQAGLQPLTVSSSYDLWRVAGTVARVSVVSSRGVTVPVPSGPIGTESTIASNVSGTLILAEPEGGWSATFNGQALRPVTVDGWAQGFVLPAGGGRLVISRDDLPRDLVLAVEALALLVAIALALPGTRAAAAQSAASSSGTAGSVRPEPAEPGPNEQTGPMARRRYAEPPPSRRTGPQPTYGTGPQPTYGTGPQPTYGTGPQPTYGTGPQPTYGTGPQPVQPAEPQPEPQPQSQQAEPQPPPVREPRRAEPRKGGSHRASRHSKPSRTWRGGRRGAGQDTPEQTEELGPDLEKLSDDLTLAMPKLFSGPADGGVMPPAVPPSVTTGGSPVQQEAPWGHSEEPDTGVARPPWELP
jgi:hypothetical protein